MKDGTFFPLSRPQRNPTKNITIEASRKTVINETIAMIVVLRHVQMVLVDNGPNLRKQ